MPDVLAIGRIARDLVPLADTLPNPARSAAVLERRGPLDGNKESIRCSP